MAIPDVSICVRELKALDKCLHGVASEDMRRKVLHDIDDEQSPLRQLLEWARTLKPIGEQHFDWEALLTDEDIDRAQ